MRHPSHWIVIVVAAAALEGCASKAEQPPPAGQANTEKDVAAINAVQDREIATVAAASADSLLAVVTSDADYMPPDEPAVRGHDALKKWAENMFSQGSFSGRYVSSDVTVSGDLAVVRYVGELTMTPKAGGAPAMERIKGIHVMKRQPDGTWKIARDVWNSDAPTASPAPPPSKNK